MPPHVVVKAAVLRFPPFDAPFVHQLVVAVLAPGQRADAPRLGGIDAPHIHLQLLLHILVHPGELLDGVLDFNFDFRQAEVFPQPAIGPVMNAGENRAAKVVRHPVGFLVIERRRYAAAAGPSLIGHGFLSSAGEPHLARIRASGAASRNFPATVSDDPLPAKKVRRTRCLSFRQRTDRARRDHPAGYLWLETDAATSHEDTLPGASLVFVGPLFR